MNDVSMNALASLPDRSGGAVRVSIFFALWSLALVLLHDERVNAAPVYDAPSNSASGCWVAPVTPPKLASESMSGALSERSDVISGRWRVAHEPSAIKHTIASRPLQRTANVVTEARKTKLANVESESNTPDVKKSSPLSAAQAEIGRRIALRDFVGALDALAIARAESPKSIDQLRLLEAHIAIGQGDPERAYTILLESLPDVRVSTQQHDLLAAVMLRTSRYTEAAAIYRALLTLDPANARWWAGYAVSQEKLDHRTEQISAYRALRSLASPGTPLATWAAERLERIG